MTPGGDSWVCGSGSQARRGASSGLGHALPALWCYGCGSSDYGLGGVSGGDGASPLFSFTSRFHDRCVRPRPFDQRQHLTVVMINLQLSHVWTGQKKAGEAVTLRSGRSLTCRILLTDEAHQFHEAHGDALFVQILFPSHAGPEPGWVDPLLKLYLSHLDPEKNTWDTGMSA